MICEGSKEANGADGEGTAVATVDIESEDVDRDVTSWKNRATATAGTTIIDSD